MVGPVEGACLAFKDKKSTTAKVQQMAQECEKLALIAKPNRCVLLAGMDKSDADDDGLSEEHMYYLIIPKGKPFRAKRAYKDTKEVSYRVAKGQWIAEVDWLQRLEGKPLSFELATSDKPTHINLRDSAILSMVGFLGTDVELDRGVYTVTPQFQSLIRKRNLFRFS